REVHDRSWVVILIGGVSRSGNVFRTSYTAACGAAGASYDMRICPSVVVCMKLRGVAGQRSGVRNGGAYRGAGIYLVEERETGRRPRGEGVDRADRRASRHANKSWT